MNIYDFRELLDDIIWDVLGAPKFPDGTLKDKDKIIQEYITKFKEKTNDK